MDRWSKEEMVAIKSKYYPHLSESSFQELLMRYVFPGTMLRFCNVDCPLIVRYGPIPRWVVEQTGSSDQIQWFQHINSALDSTDPHKSLLSTVSSSKSAAYDISVSHAVIHMRASSDHLTCFYELASSWVGEQVTEQFSLMSNFAQTKVLSVQLEFSLVITNLLFLCSEIVDGAGLRNGTTRFFFNDQWGGSLGKQLAWRVSAHVD